ncbi:MAG: HYR domain-containing protein, partial [Pseudomonadales bacterium]
ASGSLFPTGPTTVQCTATDAAGNTAQASFLVTVSPAFNASGITTTKKNPKPGTSIPLYWAWLDDNGVPVDVGTGNQEIRFMTGNCPGGNVIAADPGSSGFQQQADFSWQYNWQAVDANGDDLPASNQGGGTPYCIKVILLTTNQEQFGEVKLKP